MDLQLLALIAVTVMLLVYAIYWSLKDHRDGRAIMPIVSVDTTQEYERLLQVRGIVLIDFFSPQCGPCRVMSKILDIIVKERPGIVVAKIDTERHPEVFEIFNVHTLPTLVAMKDGGEIQRWIGVVMPEKLRAWLSEWDTPTFDPSMFSAV